jgi:hypothetical protein
MASGCGKLLRRRRVPNAGFASAAIIGTTVLIGCGDSRPYDLAPVSGVVTLDGQPLVAADIVFQPQGQGEENPGPGSNGRTDESGHYELKTIRDEPGAVVGPHTVRIYSHKPKQPGSSDVDVVPRKELVPERYNAQTELVFDVPEDGTTEADFPLTTKR